MWLTIIQALAPALGQLGMWLVGLVIKKVSPTTELKEAHMRLAALLRANGLHKVTSRFEVKK